MKFLILFALVAGASCKPSFGTFDIKPAVAMPAEIFPGVRPLPETEAGPSFMPLPVDFFPGVMPLPVEIFPGVKPLPVEIAPEVRPLPIEMPSVMPLPVEMPSGVMPLPVEIESPAKLPLVQIIVNVADPSLVEVVGPETPVGTFPLIPEELPSFGTFPEETPSFGTFPEETPSFGTFPEESMPEIVDHVDLF